jgi:hypothetical protein
MRHPSLQNGQGRTAGTGASVGDPVNCDETTRSFETARKSPSLSANPPRKRSGHNPNIVIPRRLIGVLRPEIIAEIGGGPTLVNQQAGPANAGLVAEI